MSAEVGGEKIVKKDEDRLGNRNKILEVTKISIDPIEETNTNYGYSFDGRDNPFMMRLPRFQLHCQYWTQASSNSQYGISTGVRWDWQF